MKPRHISKWTASATLLLAASLVVAASGGAVVRLAVEKEQVALGEPFLVQIRVDGGEQVEDPAFPELDAFSVQELGPQTNTRSTLSIVNGDVRRVTRHERYYSYRLTPRKTGEFTIPPVTVVVDGVVKTTSSARVRVAQPEENDDFRLRVSLSKQQCYVGEPLTAQVTWYFRKQVRNPAFQVPVLEDDRFERHELPVDQQPNRDYYRVPIAGEQCIVEGGEDRIDGKRYITLTYTCVLVPRQPGTFKFPPATVSADALVRRERVRSPFGGGLPDVFDDDFFNLGSRGVYDTVVTQSDALSVDVLPLPEQGRPSDFSGLVGVYELQAEASPREVNVGDPISLKLRVTGMPYLDHVELPPLSRQEELASRFKIPSERAPGSIEGDAKVFTQTLRALHANVESIPPVRFSYFDTRSGQYAAAESAPIPIEVRDTRVVTIDDLEGGEPGAAASQVKARSEGIAHNYEDLTVLADQSYGPDAWLDSPLRCAALAVPPVAYLAAAAVVVYRRRVSSEPESRRVRRARRALRTELARVQNHPEEAPARLLDALRAYLGARLHMQAGALTFRDVEPVLAARGIPRETIDELARLFSECEAFRYAGATAGTGSASALINRVREACMKLDKELR